MARLRELGWLFRLTIVPLVAVIAVQFACEPELAKIISTYAACISVTLSGWGAVRSLLGTLRARGAFYLIYLICFGLMFAFFVALLLQLRWGSFDAWRGSPMRPK